MVTISGSTLAELASNATKLCTDNPVNNLLLHGTFPIEEINTGFINTYMATAELWQSSSKPAELHINHGKYIYMKGDGKEYLYKELLKKKTSNRACLSLINMETIITSNDDPIPSFLILQFGFPDSSGNKILASAYFRALEVKNFLPINLAEICIYLQYFKSKFPDIREFELNVIAFRAQRIENFSCLKKSYIDLRNPVDITIAVKDIDKAEIIRLIDSKLAYQDSVINTEGLEHLLTALERCKDSYDIKLLETVSNAINKLKELKELRKSTSVHKNTEELNKEIRFCLTEAKRLLGC